MRLIQLQGLSTNRQGARDRCGCEVQQRWRRVMAGSTWHTVPFCTLVRVHPVLPLTLCLLRCLLGTLCLRECFLVSTRHAESAVFQVSRKRKMHQLYRKKKKLTFGATLHRHAGLTTVLRLLEGLAKSKTTSVSTEFLYVSTEMPAWTHAVGVHAIFSLPYAEPLLWQHLKVRKTEADAGHTSFR